MQRQRIESAVSETWGHGTIYTYEPPSMELSSANFESKSVLNPTMSTISEIPEVQVAESVSLVPIEGLSFFLSSLFATILEDIIAQMWILERCNNEISICKTLSDMDHLKGIKFSVREASDSKDELAGIDPHNLGGMVYKIHKLDADRKYINSVIVATYIDLAKSYTFHPLVRIIKQIENRDQYRAELAKEEEKNKMLRKELSKQVRQQRNHIKSMLYDTEVAIDKLRTDVEDSVLLAEIRGRYIDNWQQARAEQHKQKIYDIENKPGSTIKYYKTRIEHELRIHSEVELLVNIAINETLARIEEWMDKYDKDIEGIDLKIQIMKNDYQNMRDKRMELEETIEKHDVQMKAWIAFKELREKDRAYREKMTTSAIIVQAWWRGLLVRLELGPFKPKKPKRGFDPKKKK